jgi:hypothetical protein
MTDDESSGPLSHQVASADRDPPPSSSSARSNGLKWVAVAAVVVVAFVAGLYFPRSWLPGDIATHLPSSCSTTIAKTREITTTKLANADPAGEKELRQLADDRPDCFTDQDRRLLSR